jgi:hypothetical protein
MVQKGGAAPFSVQENLRETYPPPMTIYSQATVSICWKYRSKNGQSLPNAAKLFNDEGIENGSNYSFTVAAQAAAHFAAVG